MVLVAVGLLLLFLFFYLLYLSLFLSRYSQNIRFLLFSSFV